MPYYRRNVYILSVTVFLASLSWQQVMPYLRSFLVELGAGKHLNLWTSVVFAAQSLAAIIMMPLWGKLGDTYGRKPMIIRAGLCLAGVYYAMSLCHNPLQLTICRFLNGALTGFIPGSFALIATNTPEEEAPRSMATVQTASSVGLIIGPAVGSVLASIWSFRGSMQVSGTAVVISTLMVWWLVQEPNKVVITEKTSLVQDFAIALRSRIQVALLLAVMLSWSFGAAISPYLKGHLDMLGGGIPHWLASVLSSLHLELAAVIFAFPAVTFVLTAHRWTRLGDRWGYDRTILAGLVGGAVGATALFFVHNIWVFGAVFLVTGATMASLGPSIAAMTCLRVDEGFRGRAYGIQQSAGTIGSFSATLAAGWISTYWDLRAIFMLVGMVFLVGSIGFKGLSRHWKTEVPLPDEPA